MKFFGILLAGIGGAVLAFGMPMIRKINFDNVLEHARNQTPYMHINEPFVSNYIYIGGTIALIFGLFCIALGYALEKKAVNKQTNGGNNDRTTTELRKIYYEQNKKRTAKFANAYRKKKPRKQRLTANRTRNGLLSLQMLTVQKTKQLNNGGAQQ